MASNQLEKWSIPPIISDPNLPAEATPLPSPVDGTMRVPLRRGIVCEVNMDRAWLFQNVGLNEDAEIEYSFHGEIDGTWNVMNSHSLVKAGAPMYFLNRTRKDVIYMAAFPQ